MASTSSSYRRNEKHDDFSGIEPQGKRRTVEESSRLFDVFINHRGPDVKQTLALQLYNSLTELGLHTFLDSEENELGDSFPSTIENAIHCASAQIAIFSNGYAESPWCLAELVIMLESRAKIFPVFYGVKPSDLRYIEKGEYAKAFAKYEEQNRYMEKLEEWKEALQSVSFITGHEISGNFNISDCQNIVSAVQEEVQGTKSLHVARYPVGLDELVKDFERRCFHNLVEDFERQCRTNEGGKEKTQIVGIFGMGGVGKTTLAKELFNRKQSQYMRACFLFDVREAYANSKFPSLQLKLQKDLFQRDGFNFQCIEEGTSEIGDCIGRSNQLSFLIVLDNIDHLQQLDALLIMDMLKKSADSLVIVTTRDVGVLVNMGITTAYNLKGMDRDHARELFCWHAFGQPHPANDYQNMVNSFLNVCGGLPLSLQVLGSHVRGRDQDYWSLEMNKVRKTLHRDVLQILKISFDALDYEEKQIFMDIACFFVNKLKSISMSVWEASGWSAQHAVNTLKNKCLVQDSIEYGEDRTVWTMHDHLRDLGREMANGLSRPHRLWRPRDLEYLESKGSQNILAQTNGRCFHSIFDNRTGYRITYFAGESDYSSERATSLLWLQVEYQGFQNINRLQPSIPSWIPLQNLRCLIISNLRLKTLWQSHVQAPTHLKELQIHNSSLGEFPDLLGMSNSLEKNLIDSYSRLKTVSGLSHLKKLIELHISECFDLQELSVVGFINLEKLILHNCHSLKTVSGISDLRKLVELKISRCPVYEQLRLAGLNSLKYITVDHFFKPKYFELDDCRNLKTIAGDLNLEKLVSIEIRDCPKLELLPYLQGPGNLQTVTIDGCGKLTSFFLLSRRQNLKQVFISDCGELEELPCFARQTCLEAITIVRCGKLQNITLPTTLVELRIEDCRELKTVATICDHSECLELQELSSVARPSCLKLLTIQTCDKLQTIQGIDELHALESMQLSYCSNATVQNCIAMLKAPFLKELQINSDVEAVGSMMEENELKKGFASLSDLERLHWDGFPLRNLPSWLTLRNLRVLELHGGNELEELWEDEAHAPLQLTELIISGTWSASFERFPSSISNLNRLRKIALLGDDGKEFGIKGLPEEFCHLRSLVHLELRLCTLLSSLPARFGDLRNLRHLDMCSCKELRILPDSFNQLAHLQYLDLSGCKKLAFQVDILENITELKNLHLSGCLKLRQLPHRITDQACLREFRLQDTRLEDVPTNIGQLNKLELLTIGSPFLTNLPVSLGDLSSLKSLSIVDCIDLESLPKTLGCLSLLEHLCIESSGVKSLPEGWTKLANLRTLKISGCPLSELNFGSGSSSPLWNLRDIEISETHVARISITEDCCPRLEKLNISRNDYLEEVTLPTTVKNIEWSECERLKSKNIKAKNWQYQSV